jgi:hypothetical protein
LGLAEEIKGDCYNKVLKLCENHLSIEVSRDGIDRAHRVGQLKQASNGQPKHACPTATSYDRQTECVIVLKWNLLKLEEISVAYKFISMKIWRNQITSYTTELLYTKAHCLSEVKVWLFSGWYCCCENESSSLSY